MAVVRSVPGYAPRSNSRPKRYVSPHARHLRFLLIVTPGSAVAPCCKATVPPHGRASAYQRKGAGGAAHRSANNSPLTYTGYEIAKSGNYAAILSAARKLSLAAISRFLPRLSAVRLWPLPPKSDIALATVADSIVLRSLRLSDASATAHSSRLVFAVAKSSHAIEPLSPSAILRIPTKQSAILAPQHGKAGGQILTGGRTGVFA